MFLAVLAVGVGGPTGGMASVVITPHESPVHRDDTSHNLSPHDSLLDCTLAIRARKAIYDDLALAPLGLGVTVRQRVATIWGTVPAEELTARAIDRVKQVVGLVEVVSELRVERADDPTAAFLRTPRSSRSVDPAAPPVAHRSMTLADPPVCDAERQRPAASGIPVPDGWSPNVATNADAARPRVMPTNPIRPESAEPLAVQPLKMPTLLAPIALHGADAPHASVDAPRAPGVLTHGTTNLAEAVERLRAQNERWRHVSTRIHLGIVELNGDAAFQSAVFELAQEVSKLPGVERVVVRQLPTATDAKPARRSPK